MFLCRCLVAVEDAQLARTHRQQFAFAEALVPEALRQYVFLVKDGRIERREVVVGQRTAGEVEITKGLQAGESLIVRGLQRARPGAAAQIVNGSRPNAPNI